MKAEKAEDEHHDDDEADEIDYAVHFGLRVSLISAGFGEVGSAQARRGPFSSANSRHAKKLLASGWRLQCDAD